MSGPGNGEGANGFAPVDPYALARNEAKAAELKRFFATAEVVGRADGFALVFDGRDARTPSRRPVVLPTVAAAALLATEWNRQGEVIRPGTMPAVRLANSVIDGVADAPAPVLEEVVRYAGSDLLCYRAEAPAEQAVGEGAAAPFRLGALHVMTTLTGSALLALAVLSGHSSADDAWTATHVDEDFQIERWGQDAEAAARRDRRWADMRAAEALAAAVVASP